MNLAIIYHSESGNTKKAAEYIKSGAEIFGRRVAKKALELFN